MVHPTKVTSQRKPPRSLDLRFSIETEREADGRWIAEIPQIPGALAYGTSKDEAIKKAYAIALRAVADDVEQSRTEPPHSIKLEPAIA